MEVVTGAIRSLLPKLTNLIENEYNLQKGLKGEIMFLKAELEWMETALLKISEAPIDDQPPDSQVMLWARDVRELSYQLEDTIDEFMLRIDEPDKPPSLMGFIHRCLSLLTKAKIRHKIGMEVKDIKSRIEEVSDRRDRYRLDNIVAKPIGPTIDSLRLAALYRKATELIGTRTKSEDLISRLMLSSKQMKIVSIVGSGGLGKTTLANVVYQNIRKQFDCRAIVSISQNPNMEKIFKDLLHQLGKDLYHINDEDQLIKEMRELLETKRGTRMDVDFWDMETSADGIRRW